MTESEAVALVRKAAWARSMLLVVSSLTCLIMWSAYARGMPDVTSRGLFFGGRGYVSAAPWVLCELLLFVLFLLPARRR